MVDQEWVIKVCDRFPLMSMGDVMLLTAITPVQRDRVFWVEYVPLSVFILGSYSTDSSFHVVGCLSYNVYNLVRVDLCWISTYMNKFYLIQFLFWRGKFLFNSICQTNTIPAVNLFFSFFLPWYIPIQLNEERYVYQLGWWI